MGCSISKYGCGGKVSTNFWPGNSSLHHSVHNWWRFEVLKTELTIFFQDTNLINYLKPTALLIYRNYIFILHNIALLRQKKKKDACGNRSKYNSQSHQKNRFSTMRRQTFLPVLLEHCTNCVPETTDAFKKKKKARHCCTEYWVFSQLAIQGFDTLRQTDTFSTMCVKLVPSLMFPLRDDSQGKMKM